MDELDEVKQVELFWLGQMGLLIRFGDALVCKVPKVMEKISLL